MAVRTITARYAGTCGDCEQPIEVGTAILYGGRGRVAHANGTCTLDNVAAGPTTRERKAARAERLRGWSDKNAVRSEAVLAESHQITDMIPMGQPILVGHHSERRHRRDLDRAWNKLGKGVELGRKAENQLSRADGIEAQLDNSIYSDDPDAIERLEERIAERIAKRDRMKERNAAYRKEHRDELKGLTAYQRHEALPHASYEITNLTADIGRQRKRLEWLKREAS